MRSLRSSSLFWVVLALAFALRVWGVGFERMHADEPIVVNHALAYATGDLNPHFFKIPPLVSYLLFVVYGLWFTAGRIFGVFLDAHAFETLFFRNPELFYWVARAVFGVFLGTATVALVYRDLKKIVNDRAAFFSALFLAINFLHARDSHYVYADIPMTLAVWLAAIQAVKVRESFLLRDDILAGICVGLAAAFKYNGALVAIAVLMAHLLSDRKRWGALMAAAGASIVTFVFLNPFCVLDFSFFRAELAAQGGAEGHIGWLHPLLYSLGHGAGPAALILGLAGAYFLLFSGRARAWTLLSFPILYFISLGVFSQAHERYVLPLTPFLAALCGIAVDRLLGLGSKPRVRFCLGLFIFLALAFPLAKTVAVDILFSRPSTSAVLREWTEKNLPSGSKVAFDDSSRRPELERSVSQWKEMLGRDFSDARVAKKIQLQAELADTSRPSYELYFLSNDKTHSFSSVWPLLPFDAAALKNTGIAYVIVHYDGDLSRGDFLDSIKASGKKLVRISPYHEAERDRPSDPFAVTAAPFTWKEVFGRERLGPVFEVYAL